MGTGGTPAKLHYLSVPPCLKNVFFFCVYFLCVFQNTFPMLGYDLRTATEVPISNYRHRTFLCNLSSVFLKHHHKAHRQNVTLRSTLHIHQLHEYRYQIYKKLFWLLLYILYLLEIMWTSNCYFTHCPVFQHDCSHCCYIRTAHRDLRSVSNKDAVQKTVLQGQ